MKLTEQLKDLIGDGKSKEHYKEILKNQDDAKRLEMLLESDQAQIISKRLLKQYQEKAEKWDDLDKNTKYYAQDIEEASKTNIKNMEIVERLKIEEHHISTLLVDLQNANWDEKITRREATQIYVKKPQKILDGKREVDYNSLEKHGV